MVFHRKYLFESVKEDFLSIGPYCGSQCFHNTKYKGAKYKGPSLLNLHKMIHRDEEEKGQQNMPQSQDEGKQKIGRAHRDETFSQR